MATLNPAVTETREVSPATVTLTVSLDTAARLRALAGRCGSESSKTNDLYRELNDLAEAGLIPTLYLTNDIPTIKGMRFVATL